nr:hydrogenase maturation protease [candidate division Zixibacteria bacterium]
MKSPAPVVVIGIGNDFRSDDVAGLFIARKIRESALEGVRVIEGVSDGTSLIDAWNEAKTAVVIDCVVSGAKPGHIYRFEPLHEDLPAEYFIGYSTHAFSVAESIKLARALGQLPNRLVVYGIEGGVFKTGSGMSAEVAEAADNLVKQIASEIENFKT